MYRQIKSIFKCLKKISQMVLCQNHMSFQQCGMQDDVSVKEEAKLL